MLDEIASYLVKEKENSYKINSYKKASLIIKLLPYDIALMEQVTALKGIGESIGSLITEMLHSGTCVLLERLRRKYAKKDSKEND